MRILHIVPEFEQGGVERYVIELSEIQIAHGHQVFLATAGGIMESQLHPEVQVIHLPVQRKNPITGLYCTFCLARKHKEWDIVHAHSRVPAWICWWTSVLTDMPWIYTAHSTYSLNAGLTPLKHAPGVICVSEAVRKHLAAYLPPRTITLTNGIRGKGVPRASPFSFCRAACAAQGTGHCTESAGRTEGSPVDP